jgi:hypothetical protein
MAREAVLEQNGANVAVVLIAESAHEARMPQQALVTARDRLSFRREGQVHAVWLPLRWGGVGGKAVRRREHAGRSDWQAIASGHDSQFGVKSQAFR